MENKKRLERLVEPLKSLLIILLAVSAIGLATRTQIYSPVSTAAGWMEGLLRLFGVEESRATGNWGGSAQGVPIYPVSLAVTGPAGRWGAHYDSSTVNAAFKDKLGGLLAEALADAGTPLAVSEERWRMALTAPTVGIYYDFLGSIPLSTLSGWLGGEKNNALEHQARRLLLAGEAGGAASLYFTAGDGLFYVCRVSAEAGARLTALASELLPNRALFAFEQPELYEGLDPYVMILSEPPVTQTYEAYNPIGPETVEAGMGALLKGLSIQLQASSVYEAANGRRVRAGKDTLLIGNDGTVTFHAADSGEPRYPVSYAGEQPTAGELTETARTLVEEGLSAWCGEAGLYLMGAEQGQDGETAVYFGYLLDGAAVTVGAQGYAARVVFHGAQVSEYTFRYRAYRATGTAGAALPEVQAAAAMRVVRPEGGELQLRYLDAGGGQVSADWVVQS